MVRIVCPRAPTRALWVEEDGDESHAISVRGHGQPCETRLNAALRPRGASAQRPSTEIIGAPGSVVSAFVVAERVLELSFEPFELVEVEPV